MLGAIAGVRLTLAGLRRALPWFFTAFALLLALVFYVQQHGFGVHLPLIGFVGIEGSAPKNQRLEGEIQAMLTAQDMATDLQQAVNDQMEQGFADLAERIDENAQIQLGAARAATDSFIARNRVQPCPAIPTGGPDRAASADRAGSPADGPGMSELAGVLVSERDVRICTDNTIKAIAGHELATELVRMTVDQKD